jgi:hypothetical protein
LAWKLCTTHKSLRACKTRTSKRQFLCDLQISLGSGICSWESRTFEPSLPFAPPTGKSLRELLLDGEHVGEHSGKYLTTPSLLVQKKQLYISKSTRKCTTFHCTQNAQHMSLFCTNHRGRLVRIRKSLKRDTPHREVFWRVQEALLRNELDPGHQKALLHACRKKQNEGVLLLLFLINYLMISKKTNSIAVPKERKNGKILLGV